MPANIEIKAKVGNPDYLLKVAEQLSGKSGEIILQEDTFYNVPTGRLKLRRLQNMPSQLISYLREDCSGPKRSDYCIALIHDPNELHAVLSMALGVKGTVKKRRVLHVVDQTRIHIDEVTGLGHFMELEVVLKEGQSTEEGQEIANGLMRKLEIKDDDLQYEAYIDLLLKRQ